METTAKLQTVIFDKTGTLTLGEPSVTDVTSLNGARDEVLRLAAVAERNPEHPLGEAIVRGAQERGLDVPAAEEFVAIPGQGVEARQNGATILLGNRKLMAEKGVGGDALRPEAERLEGEGKTAMFVASGGNALGIIAVADTLKPTSPPAVRGVHAPGLEGAMV